MPIQLVFFLTESILVTVFSATCCFALVDCDHTVQQKVKINTTG